MSEHYSVPIRRFNVVGDGGAMQSRPGAKDQPLSHLNIDLIVVLGVDEWRAGGAR